MSAAVPPLTLGDALDACPFRTVLGKRVNPADPLAGVREVYASIDDGTAVPPPDMLASLVAALRQGETVLIMARTRADRDRVKALLTALSGLPAGARVMAGRVRQASSGADLAESVQGIHEEAAGVLAVDVIQRADMPELAAMALIGDPVAGRLLTMVAGAVRRIQEAPPNAPMLCGSCPRPLRDGAFSVVVACPARDDPGQGLVLAICGRCATDRAGVEQKALVALRPIWPDLRVLTMSHPDGGRA